MTQKRESVWNLHLLIKPEIAMATVGKSVFWCRAEKKTSLRSPSNGRSGGHWRFLGGGAARCVSTRLKVDLIRSDCRVCSATSPFLSVLPSRNGQTVNTNTDLNEELLRFNVAGSFHTVLLRRLSSVVMVMSALVGGLTVPHPCL